MNSNVSPEEIVIVLAGVEQTLRLIQATPEYRRLQTSEHFTTSNDRTIRNSQFAVRNCGRNWIIEPLGYKPLYLLMEDEEMRSINFQAPGFRHGVLIANCELRIGNCSGLVLNDAIQSISEVLDGIEKVQLANSLDED